MSSGQASNHSQQECDVHQGSAEGHQGVHQACPGALCLMCAKSCSYIAAQCTSARQVLTGDQQTAVISVTTGDLEPWQLPAKWKKTCSQVRTGKDAQCHTWTPRFSGWNSCSSAGCSKVGSCFFEKTKQVFRVLGGSPTW